MNSGAVQQHHRPGWPDVSDFFAGIPSRVASLRPLLGGHPIKVQDDATVSKKRVEIESPS